MHAPLFHRKIFGLITLYLLRYHQYKFDKPLPLFCWASVAFFPAEQQKKLKLGKVQEGEQDSLPFWKWLTSCECLGDISLAFEQFQFQRLSKIEQRLSKITNQSFQFYVIYKKFSTPGWRSAITCSFEISALKWGHTTVACSPDLQL